MSRPTSSGIIASAWAPPRGRTTDRYQKSIQDRMRTVTFAAARQHDRTVSPLREALAQFNRQHQGLTGTASIRLEDLITQLLSGRLWAYMLPDGRIVYHANARYDISRRLDWLEPNVGSILTRTPTGWLPTVACTPGARLRLMPSNPFAGCCPPAQVQPNSV